MNKIVTMICAVFIAAHTVWAADNVFKLKNGDKVVFYGDSITDQRLYTVIAETFVATRYPHLQIDFVNSGWGGDSVSGGGGGPIDTRLQRDIFAYRPTVVSADTSTLSNRYERTCRRLGFWPSSLLLMTT
jgi:phospholipase/lecithinase/hemolysin